MNMLSVLLITLNKCLDGFLFSVAAQIRSPDSCPLVNASEGQKKF